MKKLLLILTMFLWVSAVVFGQAEHTKGEKVGENGTLVDSIITVDGRLKNYSAGSEIPVWTDANDSITDHRIDIDTNTATGSTNGTNISDNLGYIITLNDAVGETADSATAQRVDINNNSDSITILRSEHEANVLRIAALENEVVLPGPVIDSVVVGPTNPSTVIIYTDKTLYGTTDTAHYNFVYGGGAVNPLTATISGSTIILTTDDPFLVGSQRVLDYYKPPSGGVQDINGTKMANQIGKIITNYVRNDPADGELLAFYNFELDITDSENDHDGRAYNFTDYNTDGTSYGQYAISFDGNENGFYIDDLDLTDSASIFFTWLSWGVDDFVRTLFDNRDSDGGIKISWITDPGYIELWAYDGTDSAQAKSTNVFQSGSHMIVGVTIDEPGAEAHFWANGVDVDSDSVIISGFPMDDTIMIGNDLDLGNYSAAYVDYLKMFSGLLANTDFDTLWRGLSIYPVGDTTKPTLDTSNIGKVNNYTLETFWSEPLYSLPDPNHFNLLADGTPVTLSGGVLNNNRVTYTVDTTGSTETINTAQFLFENDATDERGNHDATNVSQVFSSSIKKQGSYSAQGFANKYMYLDSPVADDTFSIVGWMYNSSAVVKSPMLTTRNTDQDGYEIGYDHIAGHSYLFTDDGGGATTLNSTTGNPTTGVWIHIGVVIDGKADTAAMYINGAYDNGGAIEATFPINEVLMLGRGRSEWNSGYYDDVQIYNTMLTAANISTLYNNVGGIIGGTVGAIDENSVLTLQYDSLGLGNYVEDLHANKADTFTVYVENAIDNPPPTPDPVGNWVVVYEQDFDQHVSLIPTKYEQALWYNDWPGLDKRDARYWAGTLDPATGLKINVMVENRTGIDQFPRLVANPDDPTDVVNQQLFPNGCINQSIGSDFYNRWDGSYLGGEIFKSPVYPDEIGAPKELYFSYNIMFKPGFQGVSGGKTPCLNGGPPMKNAMSLQEPGSTEGWSMNVMFKGNSPNGPKFNWYGFYQNMWTKDGQEPIPVGRTDEMNTYMPVYDGFSYDEENRLMLDVTVARWYTITQRFVMNTYTNGVANADGLMEFFIDGYLINGQYDIIFLGIATEDYGIDEIAFGAFFGGDKDSYMPVRDEWWYLDDFKLYYAKPGTTGMIYGNNPWPGGTKLVFPTVNTD